MKNLIEKTNDLLPALSIQVAALRKPGYPLTIRMVLPGDGRFRRREDFEPATGDVVAACAEFARDEMIVIDAPYRSLEQLEEWIENLAWSQGAWDMIRFCNPPDISPDTWRDRPGNGIGVTFGGVDSVYNIPGSTGNAIPENHTLGDIAARDGWWTWTWKPNKGFPENSIQLLSAKRGDESLEPDGSRSSPFPGWRCGKRFAGRSGEWWIGLMKSFETSDKPGLALRCVWDFRTRTFNPRA